jgi:hypothetical protein
MSRHRLELRLDDELLAKVDELRGHEPRASFVKRVLGEYAAGMMAPRWIMPPLGAREMVEALEDGAQIVVEPGSVKNLTENDRGEIVKVDPEKPAEFVLPKIAPRKRSW